MRTEAEPAPAKDKRLLVLFLFGALLLVSDLRATRPPPPGYTYTVEAGQGGAAWQVVRHGQEIGGNSASGGQKQASRESIYFPYLDQLYQRDKVPAELFIFAGKPLPINQADERALQLLPGIGPHLAHQIVTTRERNGRFAGPPDLARVKGIGPARLEQLTPAVSFQ